MGYDVSIIPRNVKGCEECGFCSFGCQYEAKQSTLVTYLQDAYECGARIVVGAHVDRVVASGGEASGVEATVTDRRRKSATAHSQSRVQIVVVAAGAIHTPAILKAIRFSESEYWAASAFAPRNGNLCCLR